MNLLFNMGIICFLFLFLVYKKYYYIAREKKSCNLREIIRDQENFINFLNEKTQTIMAPHDTRNIFCNNEETELPVVFPHHLLMIAVASTASTKG